MSSSGGNSFFVDFRLNFLLGAYKTYVLLIALTANLVDFDIASPVIASVLFLTLLICSGAALRVEAVVTRWLRLTSFDFK